MTWERCIAFVQRAEGEWDAQRTTRWGIDSRFHPGVDLETLTREAAAEIFRRDYWAPIRGDELPWPVALLTFDQAVHDGPQDAARTLQRAIGAKADGIIGPRTLERVKALQGRALVEVLLNSRADELIHRAFNHDRRSTLFGFMHRIVALALAAA